MKTILTAAFLLFAIIIQAQTVNGIPLKDINSPYIEIVGVSKLLSPGKITIEVDFGQAVKFSMKVGDQPRLLDAVGKPIIFNSMIDALNFFSANGFEFVNAYAITEGSANFYHYLLKKK